MRNDIEPTQPKPSEPSVEPFRPMRPVPPARRRLSPNDPPLPLWYTTARVVYLVLGIVESLLVIRLILKLLAANPDAGFSSLIYGTTAPLVALFQGVFLNAQGTGSVPEAATFLAMVVYALVAWGLVRLIAIAAHRELPPSA